MDDKESKNIDGIKKPDITTDNISEQIAVNVKDNAAAADNKGVTIDGAGEMSDESLHQPTTTNDNLADTSTATKTNETSGNGQSTSVIEPPQTTEADNTVNEDPGIVPSVQPSVSQASVSPATEVARLNERVKHLKVWLVVLMLLLVAVSSALVVYFSQQTKAKNDLKTQQQQNSALQQELTQQQQTATQKTIDDLNSQLAAEKTKNEQLQKTIDEQKSQINAYQTAVKQLLDACGNACNSIDVPESSTTNTTN